LRLSTLGFLQYLAPSLQFVLAITVLGEPIDPVKWASFAFIWAALAVYSWDAWRALRRGPAPPRAARTFETVSRID
jgi:chloramphenicol-sensitive protein RarD